MVNRPRLEALLSRLDQYVRVLGELGQTPADVFLADTDKIGSAKYHFVVAIECCIDMANHIISSERYRVPDSNADTFVVLVENNVIPHRLLESLRPMARFRNRLVHLYWDVDDALVQQYLQNGLDDMRAYRTAIAAWLRATEDEGASSP